MASLAPTLEAYFTDRLIRQRRVSPHTIASYRDTFRLLLAYINRTTGTPPSRLEITDLGAATIGAFLQHLEHERASTARTRNIRLAAIHSFFHYCALRHPEHAALTQRVLAIPRKRAEKRTVTFLTPTRRKRCSTPRTDQHGPAGATTRCCSPPSRPGCETPSYSASPAPTRSSAPARTSGRSAKAERRGSRR
jgi:site-specific recombinase XerD